MRDPRATYDQSMSVLRHAKKSNKNILTKSSIMLGFGETDEEVLQTLKGYFLVKIKYSLSFIKRLASSQRDYVT